jgi:hypothetical protein
MLNDEDLSFFSDRIGLQDLFPVKTTITAYIIFGVKPEELVSPSTLSLCHIYPCHWVTPFHLVLNDLQSINWQYHHIDFLKPLLSDSQLKNCTFVGSYLPTQMKWTRIIIAWQNNWIGSFKDGNAQCFGYTHIWAWPQRKFGDKGPYCIIIINEDDHTSTFFWVYPPSSDHNPLGRIRRQLNALVGY